MKKLVKLAAPLFIALSVTAAFADDMKPADTNTNPPATDTGKPAKGTKKGGKKGGSKKGGKKGGKKADTGTTDTGAAPKAQ